MWYWLKRAPKPPPPLEKDVQQAIKVMYATVGCSVYNLSQPRKTMQTPGLPDLLIFHEGKRAFWLHEVKRPGGQLRPAQVVFQKLCEWCGIAYLVGGTEAAIEHLERLNIARRAGITIRRVTP
jgi:hypothetical protein